MKLLMIFTEYFEYNPTIKVLEEAKEIKSGAKLEKSLVAFIHAEAEDMMNEKAIITKLVKNLKWAAKKNGVMSIVLHSFAHLSESKASPEFTREVFIQTEAKLINANYQVHQTPFGYFLDLNLKAPGYSMARVFKSF